MIAAATDKEPTYIGKPEPVMVDFVREKFGFGKEETVVIGDRLYTDIATAGTGKKPKKLTISAFKEVAPKRGHLFTLE